MNRNMAIDITDNKIDKKEISSNIKVKYFIFFGRMKNLLYTNTGRKGHWGRGTPCPQSFIIPFSYSFS